MNPKNKQTAVKSIIGILLSIVLFFSSGVQIPVLDSTADSYFKDSMTKAGVSYGVCRVINATVSVIQESNVQLEPAGIGLSLAVGQIVDPINDMVERLSNVLVLSITSLGVQELAYEISITIVPQIIAVLLLFLSFLVWVKNERVLQFQRILMNVLVIASIARFCLPISSIANEFLQENFFEGKIIEANEILTASTADIDKLEDVSVPKLDGFMGTIGNSASYIKEKSVDFKDTIQVIMANKGVIVENLLRLTFLYLGIFVIQVLILPLLIFWFLMRIINSLFIGTTTVAPKNRHNEHIQLN
ncbi:MAG: hypothetical protein ACI8ZB_002936 [Desulforhopalus sp.]|jgi:hypothetical protein